MVLFLTESKLPGISADTARDRRLFLLREIGCCVGVIRFGIWGSGAKLQMEGRPTHRENQVLEAASLALASFID